jgi:hypothetical protein
MHLKLAVELAGIQEHCDFDTRHLAVLRHAEEVTGNVATTACSKNPSR